MSKHAIVTARPQGPGTRWVQGRKALFHGSLGRQPKRPPVWHAPCQGRAMRLADESLLPRPRVPRNATIRSELRERGVQMLPLSGEGREVFETRIETTLMALF